MSRLVILVAIAAAGAVFAATLDDPSFLHVFLLVFSVCAIPVGWCYMREDEVTYREGDLDEIEFREYLRALDKATEDK